MTPTAQDYEEYSTSGVFAWQNILRPCPPTSRLPLPTSAEGLGSAYGYREAVARDLNRATSMGQRIRVLWIKDLARLEALVRDAGDE
jgi:hypothetical protein